MRCKIADLITEVPEAGGIAPRCRAYLYHGGELPEIVLRSDLYRPNIWPTLDENGVSYMESGMQFYARLLAFEGLMLHASAVEMNGRAYLFSGPCGIGKSTHTRLWQQTFGAAAQIFNDDKPALRCMGGKWFAYGTPWCGKDGINQNKKVPLAGICFLKQAPENSIRLLTEAEAVRRIIPQTSHRFRDVERVDLMLHNVERLVRDIPVYELGNRPESGAVELSYRTMYQKAEEMHL